MNTDDLRQTLTRHAHDTGAEAVPPVERLAAVHGRVRVVRRRRRAVLVAALVAVLGVGAALWLPADRGPAPAERPTIGGRTAPATMTSLGYGYAFAGAETGDGSARVVLTAADEPRLLSWAGSGGVVRLRSDLDLDGDGSGPGQVTPGSADFSDFLYVPAGQAQTVRVTGEGRVALAVYDLARRAPGVTQHGLTWRDDVAGGRRLAAATGELGETSVTTSLVVPAGGSMSAYTLCSGAPRGSEVELAFVDGDGSLTSGCQGGPLEWDAVTAAGGSAGFDPDTLGTPGRRVTVRLTLVHADGSRPVADAPGLRLGLGLYEDGPDRGRVGSQVVPVQVEEAGHDWVLREVLTSRPGARTLQASLDADATPVLVRTTTDHTLHGYTRTSVGGRVVSTSGDARDGGGSTQSVVRLVNQSVSAEVRVTRAGPQTVLALVVYDQAD